MQIKSGESAELQGMKVSFHSIIINAVLSVIKLAAGLAANSGAMISDALHSATDVFSTLIVIAGLKFSARESDNCHPYGHERLESITAVILAGVLAVTGISIGWKGLYAIITGHHELLNSAGALALGAAVLSIAVKEWMFYYTKRTAQKIGSDAMMADAWHHRSDALSSIGSLIGITGAMFGFPISDSIACVVICLFIMKASLDIFRDAVSKLTDHSCDGELTKEIAKKILSQEGVLCLDLIKTRKFGSKIYVDIEISADGRQTLSQAHEIAHQVHDAVEQEFLNVKHCMVHVNPLSQEKLFVVTEETMLE